MDKADAIKAKLQKHGFAMSKTFGKSMRPLIWGGQHCVVVVPLDGEPTIGDLLMFRIKQIDGNEKSIVHRLVEIRGSNSGEVADNAAAAVFDLRSATKPYITRGDNCIGCEEVCREQIIGRVAEVHRLTGWRPWHIIPRKKFTVTDRSYRLYSHLWTAIWPLRRFLYRVRGKLGAMVRGERG